MATVAKALAALRAFVDGQDEWGVRELGAALDMPPSTVHRLLARLRIEGFVGVEKAHQKYNVGFEFARLAAAVMQRHGLRQAALPLMRELTERTGESVWLALYDDEQHRIAYIAESESPHASRYLAPLGRVKSVLDGACGVAVLARLAPAERRKALKATARARVPVEVADAIAAAEASGFAAMRAGEVGAATMIAAAVCDANGAPLGSFGVVVPLHRLRAGQERLLGELVREAAERLSRRLGAKLLGGASVGSWQDAVGAISALLREHHPAIAITPATGRGGRNLDDIEQGLAAYGLTAASTLFDAYEGRAHFDEPHPRLRTVMHLSQLHLLVVARAELNVGGLAELARLRVSPGEQGFSAEQALQDAYAASGLAPGSGPRRRGAATIYLDYPEGKRQFEAGKVDALVWMTSLSNPAVRDLERSTPSRLIAPDRATIAKLVRANPGYRRGTIPRDACPNWLGADLHTLAVPTVLVCRADLPDKEVHDFARTVYEQRATLAQLSPVYEGLGADVVLDGLTAPLHPGAARYFEAMGIEPRHAGRRRTR